MRRASAAALLRAIRLERSPAHQRSLVTRSRDIVIYRIPSMLASPSLARSQTTFSQTTPSEYVEDSEPERQERRVKEKSRRKKTRTESPAKPPIDILELTDSDSDHHASPQHSALKARDEAIVVIDITDSSGDSSPHVGRDELAAPNVPRANRSEQDVFHMYQECTTDDSLPSIGEVFKLTRNVPRTQATVKNSTLADASAHGNPSPLAPSSTLQSEDSEGNEEPPKLSRFAYAAPTLLRRTASKTPSPTESGPTPAQDQAIGKAKRTRSTTHSFAADFSDSELARIMKCVSCDLAWTTRKTVSQKMKHIQSCSKKNKLAHETVRTLLRKELDSLPPMPSTSNSSTPAPEQVPETLLEDALRDTSRKKPGRRPQVLQTVKSSTETRDTILDKARSLLQGDVPSRTGSIVSEHAEPITSADAMVPPATQAFSRSNVAAVQELSGWPQANQTQLFGPSRLAAQPSRLTGATVRIGADIAAHSDISALTQVTSTSGATSGGVRIGDAGNVPPSTQIFAPSKLTNTNGVTRRVVTAAVEPSDEPISIHDTDEDGFTMSSPARPTSAFSSLSQNESPRRRSKRRSLPNDVSLILDPTSRSHTRSPPPAGEDGLRSRSPIQFETPFDAHAEAYHDHWNEWMNDVWDQDDGACLHYVPETEGVGPSSLHAHHERIAPPLLATASKDATIAGSSGTTGLAPSSHPPAKKARRKKATSEASDAEGSKMSDISQDELNAKMKEAILENEALHLRILRYEPIHFDVFLQMAVDLGIPAKRSGLKGKVRAFLDQKAIHFYGADLSKSRTRRTRHP
ncbi:hypothetical protein BD414DRAFT_473149 [Trametes punicea]|nr:hypothetical protein BD414DRAFT_473149 [Trametes punicea]